jgi:hypothetical protein
VVAERTVAVVVAEIGVRLRIAVPAVVVEVVLARTTVQHIGVWWRRAALALWDGWNKQDSERLAWQRMLNMRQKEIER